MKKSKLCLLMVLQILCIAMLFSSFTKQNFSFAHNEILTAFAHTKVLAEDTGASEADISEKGGAVYLKEGARYTMSDGSISGKSVKYGGAVFIEKNATFTLNGGTIRNNTAKYGGAIYVASGGTCNINGGEITGNRAEYEPAIYVEEGGILNINNQEVEHGNIVQLWDITINFYVDGSFNKTIERLVVDGTTFNISDAPLNYNQCPGYYTDELLCDPIETGVDFLTYSGIDTATTGVVDLYTKTATPSKLTFTSSGSTYLASTATSVTGDVVLPRTYNGKEVKITASAFASSKITSMFMHPNITEIPTNAFNGASSLVTVNIPKNTTTLSASAFNGCTALKNVEYAGTIDNWFNVSIANKTATPMYYGSNFMARGTSITSVTVPTRVTSLSYHLTGFRNLSSVNLNKVVTIGEYALYQTQKLTSVSIVSSVTTIGNNAFEGSGLRRVSIPSTVTSIGTNAFVNCNYLSRITLTASTTLSGEGILPTPSATYLENADGKWYNLSTGTGYAPNAVPSKTAATYVARKGTVTLASTSGTLTYPNQVDVEITTNTSGGTLSVKTSNSNIATAGIGGKVLTVISNTTSGTATITVTSAATEEYTAASATYTVTVNKGNFTVTASDKTVTYNGSAHGISVTSSPNGTITYSSSSNGTYSSSLTYTNAGTYTIYYKVEKAGYNTATGSKKLVINKASGKVELSATSGTITYPNTTTVTVKTNTSGGTLSVASSNTAIANVSITDTTIKIASNTTSGTATITVTSAATTNYNAASATYSVTVNKGTLSVTASDKTVTYNGSAHGISVTSSPSATITYSSSSNGTYTSSLTYTNAGTYTIYYKVEKAGYNTATGSKKLIINKAAGKVELSATSGTITYPNTTTITVKTNTSGGALSVSTSNSAIATASVSGTTVTIASNTTAGSATITVTSAATTNYTAASATYTATIKNGTLSVTASGYSGTYDGAAHSISVSSSPSATITYATSSGGTYSSTKPSYTNAGTYTTYYKVVKAGYTTVTGSKQVVINKATGTVSVSKTAVYIDITEKDRLHVTITGDGVLSAPSNNTNVITTSISGTALTINGVGGGSATISLTGVSGKNYQYGTTTINVVVKALDKIAVTKAPNDTTYYAGDNFDTTGMEVTATYTDGTSKVILDGYTMAQIPSGYTVLEYIEATGTQYIDTGLTSSDKITGIDAHHYKTSADNNQILFGMYTGSSYGYSYMDYREGASTWQMAWYGTVINSNVPVAVGDIKSSLRVDGLNFTYTINGTSVSGTSQGSPYGSTHFYLFADNSAGNPIYHMKTRLYSFKVWTSGSLARNFVPCTNPDGVVGLYDTVTKMFYSNSGTGEFGAGTAIYSQSYRALEYIEATGEQYIRTGVVGGARWEFDMQFTNTTVRQLMGYGGSGAEYWGVQTDGRYGVYGSFSLTAGNRDNLVHTYGLSNATNSLIVVGQGIAGISTTDVTSKEYQLFAISGSFLCRAKLYRCRVYNASGTMIRDYMPCIDSYGRAGLYDRINNTFSYSLGTKHFVAGPEKGHLYEYNVSNGQNLSSGQSSVTISYTENGVTKTTTQAITTTTKLLSSIEVNSVSARTDYTHGDTFDSLGLLVKANYNDGTSKLLTSQTNIDKLPSGYTFLEYIQSSGTQWIDTGYATAGGMRARYKAVFLDTAGGYIVGSHNEGSPYGRNGIYWSERTQWEFGYGETCPGFGTGTTNVIYEVDFKTTTTGAYMKVKGGDYSTWTTLTTASGQTVSSYNSYLFYNQYSEALEGSATKARLYYVDIYNSSGTLVRSYLPCKNDKGEVGMFDLVEKKFYGNDGTGAFIAGPTLSRFGYTIPNTSLTANQTAINISYTEGSVTKTTTQSIFVDRLVISAVPTIKGTYTYNGSSQTASWNNYNTSQLTIGGTYSATNAGTYSATFTPTSIYKWSDGKTTAKSVSWTIGKANNTLTLSATSGNASYSQNGSFTITNNASGGGLSVSSANTSIATASINGTTVSIAPASGASQVGKSVAIIVTSQSTTNYNAGSATYTVTIIKGNATISLSSTSGSIAYPGSVAITVTTNSDGAVVATSSNTNIATTSSVNRTVTITAGGLINSTTVKVKVDASDKFNASSELTYTISVSIPIGVYVGYSANSYTSWRIMFNSVGSLQIVSTGSVGNYTLTGNAGYANCVQYLNSYAQNWLNSTYATSARSIGCTSSTPATVSPPNTTIGGTMNNYPFDDSYYTTDVNQLVNNGLVQTDTEVWLASRRTATDGSYGVRGVCRTLTTGGVVTDSAKLQGYYWTGWDNDHSHTRGFRPVITLKSNVKCTGGSGTAASPYTIALC